MDGNKPNMLGVPLACLSVGSIYWWHSANQVHSREPNETYPFFLSDSMAGRDSRNVVETTRAALTTCATCKRLEEKCGNFSWLNTLNYIIVVKKLQKRRPTVEAGTVPVRSCHRNFTKLQRQRKECGASVKLSISNRHCLDLLLIECELTSVSFVML